MTSSTSDSPIAYSSIQLATQLPGPHIWLLDINQLAETDEARYQALLSADELARAATFKRGRREFIACRALVRLCLARYTGADPRALQFTKNASGKPLLANEHSHWNFSLSHTGTQAAFAIMPGALIGLDIEQPRKRNFLAIAAEYFHKDELAFLQALPEKQLQREFFQLWTLKEAFFKALGGGIATGLHRARFCRENQTEQWLHNFATDLGEAERDWQFYQTQIAQAQAQPLHIALAYRAPAAPIHWFNGQALFETHNP